MSLTNPSHDRRSFETVQIVSINRSLVLYLIILVEDSLVTGDLGNPVWYERAKCGHGVRHGQIRFVERNKLRIEKESHLWVLR